MTEQRSRTASYGSSTPTNAALHRATHQLGGDVGGTEHTFSLVAPNIGEVFELFSVGGRELDAERRSVVARALRAHGASPFSARFTAR